MRPGRIRYGLVALVVAVAVGAPPAAAQSPSPTTKPGGVPTIGAFEAILVNITDDSQILFTRNARVSRPPASLTKIVTALVAADEFELDEIVTTNSLVLQTHGSDLGLRPGMKISVSDLLYALLLKSANDAGMALAAHHPAGYEHFIALMNQKARSLGAYDSQFRNPHGLDQVGHYSSALDMAIFAREILRNPELAAIAGAREHTMRWKGRDRTFGHHHKLIRDNPNFISGKTGFTDNAGHSLMSTAQTSAGVLLTVVLGSIDQYGETSRLITYGKAISSRQASGGGPVEGFGALPAPPAPPGGALRDLAPDVNDPRDDLRWALMMMTFALLTAATLLSTRRGRATPVLSTAGAWLAGIAADEARRRNP